MGFKTDGRWKCYFAFGTALAFNSEGTHLVIGAPNVGESSLGALDGTGVVSVYQKNGASWSKLGSDISGEVNSKEHFGNAVSVFYHTSSSTHYVACGSFAHDNMRGTVRIYKFYNGNWIQVGVNIDGVNEGYNFGLSLKLGFSTVNNSLKLGVGAPKYDSNKGLTRLYEYVLDAIVPVWWQLGNDIIGTDIGGEPGSEISLFDGNVLAIGAPEYSSSKGRVVVYKEANSVLSQIGTIL